MTADNQRPPFYKRPHLWRNAALLLLAKALLSLIALHLWLGALAAAPGPLEAPATIIIPPGTGLRATAAQLAEAGIARPSWVFILLTLRAGEQKHLQAGEYEFPAHVSPAEIIRMMARGEVVRHQVTLPEGWTSHQLITALATAETLTGETPPVPSEGSLEPDTYRYQRGDSRATILAHMQKARTQALAAAWAARDPQTPLATPEEALTLASIVEKETGLPEERAQVAAVFLNRLRQRMPLQADPTVAYGIAKGTKLDRPLSRADLATPTPYNTYTQLGLPPGPICNPGKAALAAVLHPAATNALYFVADGSSKHRFATTLQEHAKNVAALRAWEKQRNATPETASE